MRIARELAAGVAATLALLSA
ncbi:MAG: hypothetical protein JWM33_694, partial [Caulobacteraceae bacterium]|nr:hypothetical protein [Caulobacteraceae bacterium]